MRRFRGRRTEFGCEVTIDGKPVDPRLDLRGGAAGFEWGVTGDGAVGLALAMCSAVLGRTPDGDARAMHVRRVVAETVVARLPHDSWFLTEREVLVAIREAENEIAARDAGRNARAERRGRPVERQDGVRCPSEPVGTGCRGGCGSVEVSGPYDGGLYRCRRCGLRFSVDDAPEDDRDFGGETEIDEPARPGPSPAPTPAPSAAPAARPSSRTVSAPRTVGGLLGPDPGGPYPRWRLPNAEWLRKMIEGERMRTTPWDPEWESSWRNRIRHAADVVREQVGGWLARLFGARRLAGRR